MPLPHHRAFVRRAPPTYRDYYAAQGVTIDMSRAAAQHDAYVETLRNAGVTTVFIETSPEHPDCVFVEDAAVLWNHHALITRMRPDRDGEQVLVQSVLAETHAITVVPPDALLEGGDVLHVGDVTYVGISSRTNRPGAAALRRFLEPAQRRVVEVVVDRCLHLKTGASALVDEAIIATPDLVDVLQLSAREVILVEPGENRAANVLVVNDTIIMPANCPGTEAKLRAFAASRKLQLVVLDISEFEKGEGSLTCLSIVQ